MQLEELPLYFPYDYMYPEQYDYMLAVKRSLDAKVYDLWMDESNGRFISILILNCEKFSLNDSFLNCCIIININNRATGIFFARFFLVNISSRYRIMDKVNS